MLAINFAQCSPAATQWGGANGTCWDRKITVDYSLSPGHHLGRFRLLPGHLPYNRAMDTVDELEEEAGNCRLRWALDTGVFLLAVAPL
ncbi:hypothetical protein B0T17DRAFT_540676 [Bombardia bombarda]|uniref:Uncharacterized protein n=1 Tax=Bombardia bombarda TaxID=252184 RepID=A0AA39WGG0_9PEZI|nr:hypothetical protein B0T17DRAFT_540676 [Bombardia bombarda]